MPGRQPITRPTARPAAASNYPKINSRRVSSLSLLNPYEITPAGSDGLRHWLEGTMATEGRSRNQFLVRIFFGDRTTPERLAALLDEFETAARFRLDQLAAMAEKLADRSGSVFRRSTVLFGLRHERANLDWVAEVRPILLAAAAAGTLRPCQDG